MTDHRKEKPHNEEGAIIVEAAISLSTFMFLIVIILSVTNICLAQAKIGTLINGVAKDVSNYSYIYAVSGLQGAEQSLHSKSEKASGSLNTILDSSEETMKRVQEIRSVAFDLDFWKSFGALVGESAVAYGKGEAMDAICKKIARDRLTLFERDADSYLRAIGVEDGIRGLDFRASEFCPGGNDTITIVVHYQLHALKLLGNDYQFNLTQVARTRAWGSPNTILSAYNESQEGKEKEGEDSDDEENSEDNEEEDEKPEEEEQKKSTEEIIRDSTKNASSNQVMLGDTASENYKQTARNMNMTYFDLSESDREMLLENDGKYAEDEATKRFMEAQWNAGKTFYFTENPNYPENESHYTQVDFLLRKGCRFVYDPGVGIWRAELK